MTENALRNQRELFGHPVGLYVLFFTEMWERFSYYGMRAILSLYMAASLADADPGLGYDAGKTLAVYGWYTMLVYIVSIPGGILADKFIGQKRSVMIGGLILVAGHSVLAINAIWAFYTGLALIILGVGALKPNISTMVGGLYKQGDIRRDQGFTVFYIGINVGAFLASIIVGVVAKVYGWHAGFGLAGFGMLLGQLVFMWGQKFLVGIGDPPEKNSLASKENDSTSLGELYGRLLRNPLHLAITALIALGGSALSFMYSAESQVIPYVLLSLFLAAVGGLLMSIYTDIDKVEKDKYIVLLLSFLIVIVFWGAFEQAGGLMSLYTQSKIDRDVSLWVIDALFLGGAAFLLVRGIMGSMKKKDTGYLFLALGGVVLLSYLGIRFGSDLMAFNPYEVPTAVFQAVNAFFIMIFATIVGGFWIWAKRKGWEASSLFKMAMGTIIMGVGFLFMAKASMDIEQYGDKAALMLLILAYLFHTIGELCASPVALSFITKLAPIKYVSFMMGIYFAATGLGNKVAGSIGELTQAEPVKVELAAANTNMQQLTAYTHADSLRKGASFEILGEVMMNGDQVSIQKDGVNLQDFVTLDADNLGILKKQLLEFEPENPRALTAVVRLENQEKPEEGQAANLDDYQGTVEVFEIQDAKELKTFIGIFIFTGLFGLLLILFLKRLKKLTHGVEEREQ
ncbi:MAG: peptide MFS transporter [Bacteroidia bacterium]